MAETEFITVRIPAELDEQLSQVSAPEMRGGRKAEIRIAQALRRFIESFESGQAIGGAMGVQPAPGRVDANPAKQP